MKKILTATCVSVLSLALSACGGIVHGKPQSKTAPAPRIQNVAIQPPLSEDSGWLVLPPGSGEVEIRVAADNAAKVQVFLVPTGTEQRDNAQLIGEDRNGNDGFSIRWNYPDDDITAYVLVKAQGPGGSAEDESVRVYHEKTR